MGAQSVYCVCCLRSYSFT